MPAESHKLPTKMVFKCYLNVAKGSKGLNDCRKRLRDTF